MSNNLHTALTWLLAPLLLSGCCIFGYTSTTYYEWDGDFPGKAAEVKSLCEKEAQITVDKHTQQFTQLVTGECVKDAPFASTEFVNYNSGRRSSNPDMAAKYADALCPDVRRNNKLSSEQISRHCPACSTNTFNLERCYTQSGLRQVERTGFRCAPMRLF